MKAMMMLIMISRHEVRISPFKTLSKRLFVVWSGNSISLYLTKFHKLKCAVETPASKRGEETAQFLLLIITFFLDFPRFFDFVYQFPCGILKTNG